MSSPSRNILLCLRWLCLLVIVCINAPSCQGVEKLCGNKLSDTLDLICLNGFGRKAKKSIDPLEYYSDMEEDLPLALDESPFLSMISSNALTKTRRRRHGVYDECCRKPCTMSELRSYCL